MAYDQTIERINNQQSGFQQLAKQTLSWIVYATRQLNILELRHALAVEDEATELDEENLAETDEIIHACAGLVTVEKDTNIIRLVHYTTQEYLERKLLTWEPLGEEAITRTCLTYLSFDVFTTKNPDFPKNYPIVSGWEFEEKFNNAYFLNYAIDAWHNHAEHCWNDVVEQLVVSFLEADPQILYYGAWRYVDKFKLKFRGHYKTLDMNGSKSMHFAALFGMARTATALLQAGYNTRVVDGNKCTPLIYAAGSGHQAVARLLLKDAGLQDEVGNTPLHFAAENGHENIVKLLLACEGIDVNAQSSDMYATPLNLAIRNDHEGVVKLLLERADIDVNCDPPGFRTALMVWAAVGNENVLQQLLKRDDVYLNRRNRLGETALMLAASKKIDTAVQRLLEERNIDVNCQDSKGRTALMRAFSKGPRFFLIRSLNEISTDIIVKRLLDREDIDVNLKSVDGRTALMLAAGQGSYNIVERLLIKEEIDVNCQDDGGLTALMFAANWGRYSIVNRLLEKRNINVNCQNKNGRTALMLAASKKKDAVVKRLLARHDIDRTGYD